jgi:tRNA threonylcarbamoyladenosine biosynthesis protein TsaE
MAVYETYSESETANLATRLASECPAKTVFLLEGPLGAGKSTFARSFIQSLCGEDTEVPSPTFTLVQMYESSKGLLFHFDLYRLKNPEEIFELGWEEAVSQGIVLVEWPQRLGTYLPRSAKRITIQPLSASTRKILIDEL